MSIRLLADSAGLKPAIADMAEDGWLHEFLWLCMEFQYWIDVHHQLAVQAGYAVAEHQAPTWFDGLHGFPSAEILLDTADPSWLFWQPKLGQFGWIAPSERERSHKLLDQAWDEHEKELSKAGLGLFKLTHGLRQVHWARLRVMDEKSTNDILCHMGAECAAFPHHHFDASTVTKALKLLFARGLVGLHTPLQRRSRRGLGRLS